MSEAQLDIGPVLEHLERIEKRMDELRDSLTDGKLAGLSGDELIAVYGQVNSMFTDTAEIGSTLERIAAAGSAISGAITEEMTQRALGEK